MLKTAVFDAHVHIGSKGVDINTFFDDCKKIENFRKKYDIKKAIVSVFPAIGSLICPFCSDHIVQVFEINKKEVVKCLECNYRKELQYSVFRDYNLILAAIAKKSTWMIPYAMEIVSPYCLLNEISYTLEMFPEIKGIKLYTGFSATHLNDVDLPFDIPLLVHVGKYDNQNINSMKQFLKKYRGPIQLAHMGRMDIPNIKELIPFKNVFFDCSPLSLLYQTRRQRLFFNQFDSIEDMFFQLLDIVGIDRIVFGSDFPFGNVEQDVSVVQSLGLTQSEKEKVLYKNIERILLL